MCHQQFALADEFTVLLPFDGLHGDGATSVHVKAVGLSSVHLGVGGAVSHQGTFADLCVDASRDEKGDVDVVVFQLQGLVKAEQGVFGGAVGTSEWKSEKS